ncbi:SGNH/GDSL hydrolase family protein, partial [Acidisphaera rubrifaciens]|uniref:SGNH/GDSL hydrolase family protein n=1 Tax=Acidisphaera rubrifaciens TaxID=50715 RepID=UPI000B2D292F
ILVIGDSQAQGLAGAFMRRYRRDRDIRVIDRSKIATGLIPRASYDWPTEIKTIAEKDHADVAVVMFGANDRPPVRRHGMLDPQLVEAFTDSYGATVTEIVDALRAAHMPVVWVGHPIVRDPDFSSDMSMLDGIYQKYATDAGATYVSTWNLFAAPDGSYSAYGPGLDGVTTRLRADDGVHLTPAGYDVLARMLEPYLEVPPPASAQALPN